MTAERRDRIVIIGAGFSGTLVAVNLLRACRDRTLEIALIERSLPCGRGLAYRTWDDNLLLNVPAGNMSALADDPGHFLRHCAGIDPAFGSSSFVSRRIYGDYLEDTLAEARRNSAASLRRVHDEAVAIQRRSDGGFEVRLASGDSLRADKVVLSFGHLPPTRPVFFPSDDAGGHCVSDPWATDVPDGVPVLLVGTGLTAVDMLFRLNARDRSRRIVLLSRHGLLPQPHRPVAAPPPPSATLPAFIASDAPPTVRRVLRALRDEVARREAAGGNWRDVVNELRSHTPSLWRALSSEERRRFLRHVVTYWDIHRHRAAPSAHLRLQRLIDEQRVEVLAGRILKCRAEGSTLRVTLSRRKSNATFELAVGAVINCTGLSGDVAKATAPLLRQLLADGFVTADALRLGLEVTEDYRPIAADGRPAAGLFYVGPMLRARDWEAIAVPELRVHAARLAQALVECA
jgi:uncharacterized NAD(P)/FAD-binding protein YdhS